MHILEYSLTEKGLKIKYTKKCDICNFAHVDLLSDNLTCIVKNYLIIEEESICDKFKIKKQAKQQIIDSCSLKIKGGLNENRL